MVAPVFRHLIKLRNDFIVWRFNKHYKENPKVEETLAMLDELCGVANLIQSENIDWKVCEETTIEPYFPCFEEWVRHVDLVLNALAVHDVLGYTRGKQRDMQLINWLLKNHNYSTSDMVDIARSKLFSLQGEVSKHPDLFEKRNAQLALYPVVMDARLWLNVI
jgi:hypothetical protein